ncbi:MAG: BMP family ABC transporter substrate-binding protein [Thermoleophilia bacterium]|nr:BMP family ABC transporter substrate-binding protein [Thermoleophilia bacterium]
MWGSRWRALLLAMAVVAAVAMVAAGCGDDDDDGGGDSGDGEGELVGLVSDIGKFSDRSFNQSALEGMTRAEEEFGVMGRPIESVAASDYIPNLTTLARQDAAVTIGVGFLMAEALTTVAGQFPDNDFAIVDFPQAALEGMPSNVRGLNFATNENSYLVGYMAAKMAERAGGKQVISAVGGEKLPSVTIFMAGYTAGAKAANPDVQVLINYSQDFVAQDKCKELALNQIQKGSQVVFQVAGGCGLGALDAARERGVWGIGVDRDQSDLGGHILTSAVKRVDTSVFDTIKAATEGNFEGGDVNFNLANEGVAVGTTSPEVPQELLDEIDGLRQQIIDGELEVPAAL